MEKKELSLFEKIIFEAPEDTPPDMPVDQGTDAPPDIPDMAGDPPPDIGADMDAPPDMEGDAPPDMGDEDTMGGFGDEGEIEEDPNENLEIDEKISAIMNMNLYQRFLSLLGNIGNQLSMIKNKSDMLYTLSSDSLEIIQALKKLDENIRLYLQNYFPNENYSKNLLFFNKCLNLLKLSNDIFDQKVRKGIRSID